MIRYLLYRAKFRLRQWIPGKYPVHVDIELAGKCQLACVMCPFGEGTFDESKQGMMTWGMAKEALEQAREMGALSVKLNFRGEPGLAKRTLSAAVQHAKALGFVDIIINTNLTSFSKERLKRLVDDGLTTMVVSIDGATPETYEAIRINGDFKKLLGNLRYVNTLPNRPSIRINFTTQERNRHERLMMDEVFGDLCDEIRFNAIRSDNSGKRKKCPQPSQRLVIMWDGQVGGCCSNWNNEAIIGQFPQQSLRKIWNGINRKLLLEYAVDPNRGGPCKGCLVGDSYK